MGMLDTESAGGESGTATRLPFDLFRLSEDILNSTDPLREILSQYKEHSRESDGMS